MPRMFRDRPMRPNDLFLIVVVLLMLSVGSGLLSGCTTLADVTKNPACTTRVTLKGAYGAGIPTGTYSASAVCNAPAKTPVAAVAPPAADDPVPQPPPT